MKIYEYSDYKKYVTRWIYQLPARGRGEHTRIAKLLNIHTTMVTHILKGKSHLTMEQSLKLSSHLGLNELEKDYFITLVHYNRASDKDTQKYCMEKLHDIRQKAMNLTNRLEIKNELSESDRAFYYSSYLYSMVRLLTAIDRFQDIPSIAAELDLPMNKIKRVIDFLLSRNLCTEVNGKIKFGDVSTYVEASSPLSHRHHLNWRYKTQQQFENIREEDLVFTFPTVINEDCAKEIREKLVQSIEEIKKVSLPSPSKELYILNVDWMKMTKTK